MKKFIKNRLGVILIFFVIVITYTLLTDVFEILDSFLFPGPSRVLPNIPEKAPELLEGLVSSLLLLIPSFLLALLLGILIGVPIGLKRIIRSNIMPYINAFSAIPATLLTPFAIHIFPSFQSASRFIIFIGSFWIILGTTISGVTTIDKKYLNVANTLEISGLERIVRVILPAASPTILSGTAIALKFSFILLTSAEMFGATSGLGYFIQYYSDFAKYELVWVGFLFLSLVLVIIMYIFDSIKTRLLHWTINN